MIFWMMEQFSQIGFSDPSSFLMLGSEKFSDFLFKMKIADIINPFFNMICETKKQQDLHKLVAAWNLKSYLDIIGDKEMLFEMSLR